MPIHKMMLDGDLFVAKAVGYLDNTDAKLWANALRNHAQSQLPSISAIIDMTEVDRLCPTLTKIFAEASKSSNMRAIAVVISDTMVSQNMRVIDKLNELSGVRLFAVYSEAKRFALARANAPANVTMWSGAPAMAAGAY